MPQLEPLYFKYTSASGKMQWARYIFTDDEVIFERDWYCPPYKTLHRYSNTGNRDGKRQAMVAMGWEPCSYEEFIKQRILSKHD